jgi:DNA-nicking Smr family endonuclease
MAKNKRRARPRRANEPKAEKSVFASPFKDLRRMLKDRPTAKGAAEGIRATVAPTTPESPLTALDDDTIFRQAVDGVRRLSDAGATRVVPALEMSREIVSEDAEVLAQLSDLVAGTAPFELTETEEYVEGTRLGLDPRLVVRLRRGEFAVQAHIDLHGMIQSDARAALEDFIVNSVRKGMRAVLVVHGRGLRSPGGMPVLKHAAAQWLSHGQMGGYVLAFSTARSADGGAGAMYVLLRRERRRAHFDILHGAKRRE